MIKPTNIELNRPVLNAHFVILHTIKCSARFGKTVLNKIQHLNIHSYEILLLCSLRSTSVAQYTMILICKQLEMSSSDLHNTSQGPQHMLQKMVPKLTLFF